MQIKELSKECDFKGIFEVLKSQYKIYDEEYFKYEGVFNKIRESAQLNIDTILVTIKQYEDYIDVYGVDLEKNKPLTLEYSTFEEWGNFTVLIENKNKFEIMAHILQEATYNGFTDEDIKSAIFNNLK